MRVRQLSSIAALLFSSAALVAQGQNERPAQFRAGVELIQLDAVVLDGKRQPVTGLTEADFTVLDDGKPTPIRAFTPIQLATRTRATEAVWASEVPRDVISNQIGEQEGRLVIILLDRTIPAHEASATAKKIATAAVESLGPNDLAAVVSTLTNAVQSERVQGLTSDRTRLLRAINAGDPATGITPDAEAIMGKLDPFTDPRCLCGICVHQTIQRVAEAVQDTPRRRKLLLFIGSDMIWQASNPIAASVKTPCELQVKDARTAMLAAVDRANLTIHSIDPGSLANIGPQTRGGTPGGWDARSGPTYGPNARVIKQQEVTRDAVSSRENLKLLPDRTGGRFVSGRNNPEQTIPEIIHETDAYYVLGIERAASTRSDGTRSIEVKVARKGLTVHAQRQYGPPAPQRAATSEGESRPAAASADALTRLLPSAGVPLSLAVMPFANPDAAKPIVRVNIDTSAFLRADGRSVPLQIAVLAVDRTGKGVASARQLSNIAAAGSAPNDVREVNVLSQLELEPGDYGIRVAVSDTGTGKVASVFADTTVPNFAEAPLSLSGVSVETTGAAPTAYMPTTRRTFARGDQVRAVMQIYQGTERADSIALVSMRVQILDAKGASVRDESLLFAETAFTNRRADCVITLPLATLPTGEYLLKLEASSGRHTSGRAIRFEVH